MLLPIPTQHQQPWLVSGSLSGASRVCDVPRLRSPRAMLYAALQMVQEQKMGGGQKKLQPKPLGMGGDGGGGLKSIQLALLEQQQLFPPAPGVAVEAEQSVRDFTSTGGSRAERVGRGELLSRVSAGLCPRAADTEGAVPENSSNAGPMSAALGKGWALGLGPGPGRSVVCSAAAAGALCLKGTGPTPPSLQRFSYCYK